MKQTKLGFLTKSSNDEVSVRSVEQIRLKLWSIRYCFENDLDNLDELGLLNPHIEEEIKRIINAIRDFQYRFYV